MDDVLRCAFLIALLALCSRQQICAEPSTGSGPRIAYTTCSAEAFLHLVKADEAGVQPDREAWAALFATEGYRSFFRMIASPEAWRRDIAGAFSLACDPRSEDACDSLLQAPATDENMLRRDVVKNFRDLKYNAHAVEAYLSTVDSRGCSTGQTAFAGVFLPDGGTGLAPDFGTFHFVAFDPEARNLGDAIFFDINSFYAEGEAGRVALLAHELPTAT